MKKISPSHCKATVSDQMPIAFLSTERIIRETTPLYSRPHGFQTLGELVDSIIGEAIADNADMQNIALEFSPEQWRDYAERVNPKVNPLASDDWTPYAEEN